MKYVKLYRRFVVVYMKGKWKYHFALLLELIANTILMGIYFADFWIVFNNFETIAGWSKYEVLFLFTTSWLAYSFSCFFRRFLDIQHEKTADWLDMGSNDFLWR